MSMSKKLAGMSKILAWEPHGHVKHIGDEVLKIDFETNHKPLVPLLGTKDLDKLPPRVLRFRLLARIQY